MKNNDLKSKSKFLSLVLRHKPETIGLVLDKEGWASISELCEKMPISKEDLQDIVATDDKNRYTTDLTGTKIRANQGHSIKVDLKLSKERPPDELYHGTKEEFLDSIKKNGLSKMNRNHVHLSQDILTAKNVADRRKGKSVILKIDAIQMRAHNYSFYLSENNVWLTDNVPARFITILK